MTHGNVVYQGIRGTAPRVFYWRLVIKPPAISHITKFQSPKGKQVSCKSHCCTLRHFYHLRKEGISSKVQVPRSQLRATLQAGLSMLILSYTTVWEDMVAFRSSRSPASLHLHCYVPAPIFRIPLLYNQCNVVRLRIRFHYNSALIK